MEPNIPIPTTKPPRPPLKTSHTGTPHCLNRTQSFINPKSLYQWGPQTSFGSYKGLSSPTSPINPSITPGTTIMPKIAETGGTALSRLANRRNFMVERKLSMIDASAPRGRYASTYATVDRMTLNRSSSFSARSTTNKGVLVQEIDEGQPCLMCRDKCEKGYKPHTWRKTCQSCRCTRELHDVYHEDWVNVRERLGLGDALGRSNRELCLQEGYAWVPPGLVSEQVYDYMSCLPGHKVPRIGTPGEKYRERQLMLQLPKQDLALAFTRHVEPQYHTSYKDFIQARNDIALDLGIVKHYIPQDMACRGCKTVIPKGSVAVIASRLGDDAVYHPSCFTCSTCKEFLVDLVYCIWGETINCGRHYAEKLKPRCAACDELIFSGEYTKAMSKDWHSGHFCCWQCDDSLTGQRYVLKDDHPYCIKCYESIFANTCDDCTKIIGIDSKDLSYKDRHWHEKCFLCSKCQVSLVDKQFGSKQEKIFCGPCYDAQYASRCDSCGEVFRAGNKKMEYRQRQWHEKCFCCCVCKSTIGTRSFIPRDQDIYCAGCYEEKFATRCIKCDKIITTGGVTYKNEPWHRECFTCTNCDKSLAGQRFTSKEEKPYCADCFGELFAKRCTACTKPITGIGGTRFISFEDRHWHNDCFICAMCKGSLVGKGFITDGADVLCPECAKQKLM